ncbi:MAG: amidohydrolase [Microbacteriaceae bacterium]|nr:amidohydrolase [Microbacteriaceae bacterium]
MTTIVRADTMLTPAGEVSPAELEIDDAGRISYAGTPRSGSIVTHDLTGHALMPGLVNGHTHGAMTLQRGISDDEGFMPWLAAVQEVEQGLTRDDIVVGLEVAMLEMIETGTTTFADMYHWDAGLLELVRDAGMRVLAAPAMSTADSVAFPGVSPLTGAEVLDETEALAARFAGDAQIKLAYGPHAPYTCPPELLQDIAARSKRSGIPIHIHVSESRAEVAQMTEQYGRTPAAHLDSLGFFEARVLAAHCVHLTDDEIEVFARTGTGASHNPVSNLKLGCGVARLPEMLDAGIALTIGTDSVASNNSLDLFEELKLATILHRGMRHDASVVSAAQVLDLATRQGAATVGFPETGSLEFGKLADVIALDLGRTSATPRGSLASHLTFSATGADVRHVFIGGQHVYADGEHLTLDAPAIRERAHAASARLRPQT